MDWPPDVPGWLCLVAPSRGHIRPCSPPSRVDVSLIPLTLVSIPVLIHSSLIQILLSSLHQLLANLTWNHLKGGWLCLLELVRLQCEVGQRAQALSCFCSEPWKSLKRTIVRIINHWYINTGFSSYPWRGHPLHSFLLFAGFFASHFLVNSLMRFCFILSLPWLPALALGPEVQMDYFPFLLPLHQVQRAKSLVGGKESFPAGLGERSSHWKNHFPNSNFATFHSVRTQ